MENNKIRIAIVQDNNRVGHELILKAFAEQEMMELCAPIIYGSGKDLANCNKALGLNTHLKITDCANNALDKALNDFQQGAFEALVIGPSKNNPFKNPRLSGSMPVYLNEQTRIVLLTNSSNPEEMEKDITEENIIAKAKAFRAILKRDYRLSNPRIAVLASSPEANSKEDTEIIAPAINKMAEEFIPVYGPYNAETFFDNGDHTAFDGIIAINNDQRIMAGNLLSDNNDIISISGLNLPCAALITNINETEQGSADENELRQAIYQVTDMLRFRKEYDAPMRNPLPKLYHERPDSGEKLRFSIPKKKEEE